MTFLSFDDVIGTSSSCGGKCGGKCGPCDSARQTDPVQFFPLKGGVIPLQAAPRSPYQPWWIPPQPQPKRRFLGPPVRRPPGGLAGRRPLFSTNPPRPQPLPPQPVPPGYFPPPVKPVPASVVKDNFDDTLGAVINTNGQRVGTPDPPECTWGTPTLIGGRWRCPPNPNETGRCPDGQTLMDGVCRPNGYLGPPSRQTTSMTGTLCRTASGHPGIASGGRCYELVPSTPLTHGSGASYTGTVFTGDSTPIATGGTGTGTGTGTVTGGTGTGTGTGIGLGTGTIFGLSPLVLLGIGGAALLLFSSSNSK